ncbi:MAG: hypothetical protein HQL54_10335 [Magnetococcales bacterium]|nr:hypothetical protein [Magnetococcales bacterium]
MRYNTRLGTAPRSRPPLEGRLTSENHPTALSDTERSYQLGELRYLLEDCSTLSALMEAFTLWMDQLVDVQLVTYWNPRLRRNAVVCNSPYQERNALLHTAWDMIEGPLPRVHFWKQQSWYFHLMSSKPLNRWDRLLLIERGNKLSMEAISQIMREAGLVMNAPLTQILANK